jgi:hypothetical protein
MRQLRRVNGWTASAVAEGYGCHVSHISRIERGARPSRTLVEFYEEQFEAEGMLLSLFEVVDYNAEQERRRAGGHRPRRIKAITGDASTFVDDTVPHGTQLEPGIIFVKTWRIRNSGAVAWKGRRLERQGPLTGPGLITSIVRHSEIPDAEPGETVEIEVPLKAPGYDCTSIAYFKMIDADGNLCFPSNYQLGLDVLVRVERVAAGTQPGVTSVLSSSSSPSES